jgi:tRNA threonylcarbamoyladenosine biosynthesis protein TsaB
VLILGIDTSGRQGSVALLRADTHTEPRAEGDPLHTLELVSLEGGQYSELLVPTIAGLLERHGQERSEIDLIAVASGPGSFTGLRIAIATVKGLAEAFSTPVVAVSVLEAVALAALAEGKVLAALDAQRSEVFSGEYLVNRQNADPAQMIRESIASFGGFAAVLAAENVQEVFTPDETIATRLTEIGIESHRLARPNAEAYARIAYRKFCSGVRADVATLDANYLRRSDAEIFSAPKLGIA